MVHSIGKRVKQAREEAKITQRELAEQVGISEHAMQKIEWGLTKNPRGLDKLASVLKKTKEYLMYGVQSELPKKIPIIPFQNIKDYLTMTSQDMEKWEDWMLNFGNFGSDCYALRVENDSMCANVPSEKTFKAGEIVIFKKDEKPVSNKFVVYSEDGGKTASFKQYITDGARKYLKPLNPHYPIIPVTSNIKIFGVVVAHADLAL